MAGLDLDRGDALGHQRRHALGGAGDQLVLAGGAGRLDRRDDTAARLGDLLVGGALEPQLELVRPVAAIDDMGVAVDQPRCHPAPLEVDARLSGTGILARAHPGDLVAADPDRRILDRAIGFLAGHGRGIAVLEEQVGLRRHKSRSPDQLARHPR